MKPNTVKYWLSCQIDRLDTMVLLEDATGKDRSWLLAHPEWELSSDQQNVLSEWVERRMGHEPLAYIRGKCEFYGREFVVSPAVLVPRPESEAMIDVLRRFVLRQGSENGSERVDSTALLAAAANNTLQVIDIGTGSGALAVSAAAELPGMTVRAVDIDPACLTIAQQNAEMHDVRITLAKSDLLAALTDEVLANPAILLCNLPYVPDDYAINDAARHEPRLALFAGLDGLDLYRKLFEQLTDRQFQPLLILTEALPEQHTALNQLASVHGYDLTLTEDFVQAFQPRIQSI